jgi:hypothetical protein
MRYGHASASIMVVGAPQPMPGCSRFASPLGPLAALEGEAAPPYEPTYASMWRRLPCINHIVRTLAHALGIDFIDTAMMALQAP